METGTGTERGKPQRSTPEHACDCATCALTATLSDLMGGFSHREIDAKWQAYWDEHNIFATPTDRTRPKYYVLDMFPYPSGSGLHVGHPKGYVATDVVAR